MKIYYTVSSELTSITLLLNLNQFITGTVCCSKVWNLFLITYTLSSDLELVAERTPNLFIIVYSEHVKYITKGVITF